MDKLTQLSSKYANNPFVRMIVNVIPYVGGSLDVLLSEKWNSYNQQRLDSLLNYLSIDLEDVKNDINQEYLESEELYDIVIKVINESIKTRLDDKRKLFSKVIRDSLSKNKKIYITESVLSIISELNELDFVFIKEVQGFITKKNQIWFSAEDIYASFDNNAFDINEAVRVLFRFSYLGLLDYKTTSLTLREKIEFSSTPFFECIFNYLSE